VDCPDQICRKHGQLFGESETISGSLCIWKLGRQDLLFSEETMSHKEVMTREIVTEKQLKNSLTVSNLIKILVCNKIGAPTRN